MPENGLFSILDSVDSTNNYAMGIVHAGLAKHGMAWFAHEQTKGKGQRGKSWQSGKGENIALSIVLVPKGLKAPEVFKISVMVSLACTHFINGFAGSEVFIKWPNDIYWRDRKAGGILIENVMQGGTWKYAVVGIGINVNQTSFSGGLKNPVSLKEITGKSFDIEALAKGLHKAVLLAVEEMGSKPFSTFLAEYNHYLYKLNSTVKLKAENKVFECIINGVNERGKLLTSGASNKEFEFGQVEWII